MRAHPDLVFNTPEARCPSTKGHPAFRDRATVTSIVLTASGAYKLAASLMHLILEKAFPHFVPLSLVTRNTAATARVHVRMRNIYTPAGHEAVSRLMEDIPDVDASRLLLSLFLPSTS